MKTLTLLICALPVLAAASPAPPDRDLSRFSLDDGRGGLLVGGSGDPAKAGGDTICLIGPASVPGVQAIGTFQDALGNPAWNGWTHVDGTQVSVSHWQASTYRAVAGAWSAWCGEAFASCGPDDPEGGYGNGYDDMIEWRGQVADNTVGCTVTVTAVLQYDVEPGYDYVYLSCEKFGQGLVDVLVRDGTGVLAVDASFAYAPRDYLGAGRDEVAVLFRVTSDGAWSDADCLWPTGGACQLDDVAIGLSNGTGYATDFEDGTLGAFAIRIPPGAGDFTQLWTGLEDLDPCATNYGPQVAFVDDGVVVPGTGGTPCVNWCYGPNGYIVNTTGGLAGPEAAVQNHVDSPVLAWPDATHGGARLEFDLYVHEDLGADSPGVFATFYVRSADTDTGQDIAGAPWRNDGYVRYGGPGYVRYAPILDQLLVPGRDLVQVRLTVWDMGHIFGFTGNDGYPAPYFDNVRLVSYPTAGPTLTGTTQWWANDNFIEQDGYDPAQPGSNHVRFDAAARISWDDPTRNDPGDSILVTCTPTRAGAVLTGNPRMHYSLKRNPLFDPYRTSGLPDQGYVVCDSVRNWLGQIVPHRFSADLPDTGFLFPGDRIRYYFRAEDTDGATTGWSILPADTTGYSDWSGRGSYLLTMRALPTITDLATGAHPPVLIWYDVGFVPAVWDAAFAQLGLVKGRDYDEYVTSFPSNPHGNGLGGRATYRDIMGYTEMIYTSGSRPTFTITDGDWEGDPTSSAALVIQWLYSGGKDMLLTGDDLASDLAQSGAVTSQLLEDYLGLAVVASDVRPLIGGQTSPRVLPEPGNPVFFTVDSWIAYGGCPYVSTFDAVVPVGSAQRLAQFASPAGVPGGYPYAAATLHQAEIGGSRVISFPYDFFFIDTDSEESAAPGALAARTRILADVLAYFGIEGDPGSVSAVPAAPRFTLGSHPNPFNPGTTIRYTVTRPGRLTLKIFDVRGELVRTLVDGHVAASAAVAWDGTDDGGARAASGVYFCEARMGGEVLVRKMTLVK